MSLYHDMDTYPICLSLSLSMRARRVGSLLGMMRTIVDDGQLELSCVVVQCRDAQVYRCIYTQCASCVVKGSRVP